MCGIFGIYSKKKINSEDLNLENRANKFLNHRGPDEFNLYQDKENNLILCHSRLSIIDISKKNSQPRKEKKNVLLVAADTFRAAAAEQLNEWADKIGTDFIRDADKSDPASVVFKSIEYANKNNIDVVIIDTAGRLQNKTDLMDQLGKIDRVLKKHDETLPHDSIISIDATTGQNALKQVEEFNKFTKITGIIMTKFDSNAAGGTLVSISNKTKIPILAIGSGEQISDLIDFDPEQFSNNFIKN